MNSDILKQNRGKLFNSVNEYLRVVEGLVADGAFKDIDDTPFDYGVFKETLDLGVSIGVDISPWLEITDEYNPMKISALRRWVMDHLDWENRWKNPRFMEEIQKIKDEGFVQIKEFNRATLETTMDIVYFVKAGDSVLQYAKDFSSMFSNVLMNQYEQQLIRNLRHISDAPIIKLMMQEDISTKVFTHTAVSL